MEQGTQSQCSGTTQGNCVEGGLGGGGVQDGNIEISSTAVNEKNILFLDDKA